MKASSVVPLAYLFRVAGSGADSPDQKAQQQDARSQGNPADGHGASVIAEEFGEFGHRTLQTFQVSLLVQPGLQDTPASNPFDAAMAL